MADVDCVLDAKARTGEGAVWDERERVLWWTDIPAGRLNRFDPSSGANRVWEIGEELGCFALREGGGFVLATRTGFHLYDTATRAKQPLGDPEADKPESRFNDGATDMQGRFWAGTMKTGPQREPVGAFYRLDPDHGVSKGFNGFYTSNGCSFSPDGRTMYVSDSHPEVQSIWACDYDPDDGTPSNRRVFATTHDLPGRPDGGTVDADGCYWIAGVGGWQLVRFTPAGKVDRIVDMPVERPTKIAFGGRNLDVMYVTSIRSGEGEDPKQPHAGGLFAVHAGVQGLPHVRFAG